MAAVSGPSLDRHPSPFRKAQKSFQPSAATTAHSPTSVSQSLKLSLFLPSFLLPSCGRMPAGVTCIMNISPQASLVVILYPISLLVLTSPSPGKIFHFLCIISLLMSSTTPVFTHMPPPPSLQPPLHPSSPVCNFHLPSPSTVPIFTHLQLL